MAIATSPIVRKSGSLKAAGNVVRSGDSREKLLKDAMREINVGLDEMTPLDRESAITGIHAIAQTVRQSREKSIGR
jgi:hypothetical protein